MPDPRETELKFELEPSDIGKLRARLVKLVGAERDIERLSSVYYDTANHHLQAGGLTFRIRTVADRRIQTVKASRGLGVGLFDRNEWEIEIASGEPDLDAAQQTPVADVLGKHAGQLGPIFETIIDRHIWIMTTDTADIEVALDEGRVVASATTQAFAELELELKRGAPDDLFDLVRRLGDVSTLRLGVLTKSERGYRLLDGKGSKPSKAEPVSLERGATTADAFQSIVRSCLRQFRLNEPLVIATREPESLHQLRVAMRRLRSALSLFKRVGADEAFDDLANRLQAASRQFGDARNLDVYLAAVAKPEAEGHPGEPGAAAYLALIETCRTAAYDLTTRTLRSRAFRALMIDLMAWVEAGDWLTVEDPARKALREQPIEVFAADCLAGLTRKIKKAGHHLDKLDPHHRHRVRIKAKKLRYAADFFGGLVGKKKRDRHKAFLAALADLQQHLGDLNDIQTAGMIAHDLATAAKRQAKREPALALLAAGHATGLQDARTEHLLEAADAAHKAFSAVKPFWNSWRA